MRDFRECRPYIEYLLAEHRRLHQMLLRADRSIAHGKETIGGKDGMLTLRTLQKIRHELARHFEAEEEGGCLEEALAFCPQMAPEMAQIMAEHPRLLAELDRLIIEAADDAGKVRNRVLLRRDFDEFCRDLEAHERAENELLRRGFGMHAEDEPLRIDTANML